MKPRISYCPQFVRFNIDFCPPALCAKTQTSYDSGHVVFGVQLQQA